MNDLPGQELLSGDEVSPRSLKIDHESSVCWLTWGLVRKDTEFNSVTVYALDGSATPATVAMQLNILGVDAPKMGEWWLNASKTADGDWKAEVVPVRPHPHPGLTIKASTGMENNIKAVKFVIVLPAQDELYTQEFPYYGLKVYANTKVGLIQARRFRNVGQGNHLGVDGRAQERMEFK
jgi:hypothetical protein